MTSIAASSSSLIIPASFSPRKTHDETKSKSSASVRNPRNEQKVAEASINARQKATSVYANRGDVNSCGHWLALALKVNFRNENGSFDLTARKAYLKDND